MAIRTIHIKRHERGLKFRRGDFQELLGAGTYRRVALMDMLRKITVEVVSMLQPKFEHELLDVLVKNEQLREALHVVELKDTERALVWQDGRLVWIIGPGRHAFWKEPYDIRTEIFDVEAEPRVEGVLADQIRALPYAQHWVGVVDVPAHHEVLVLRDGQLVARLDRGPYVYWKTSRAMDVVSVDRREQTSDVAGQEIMTRDKVTLRVNLVVTWQVVDTVKSVEAARDVDRALYREAQLALRGAVGTRTLDQLLSDKEAVAGEVEGALTARAPEYGLVVRSIGLRDVILPGDMKTILNEVILAQKQSEANLIRRREETAAARSQANTARLLAENPVLQRMKELESLQAILQGTKATFVLGSGDLGGQLTSLLAHKDASETE